MKSRDTGAWTPLRIAFLYAFLGALWILFSDSIVLSLSSDTSLLSRLQTYKGWLFILVTATLLFGLMSSMIGQRKMILHELRLSEEKFAKAFRNSPAAIALTSMPDGQLVEVNESFLRFGGHRLDEIIGRTTLDLHFWVKPADRQRFIDMLHAHGRATDMEADFYNTSGEIRRGLVSGELIEVQGSAYILTVIFDITERKAAEAALENERGFLSALLDNISEAMVSCDGSGRLVRFNEAARRLHGLPAQPIMPEQWAEHYDLYQADGRTRMPLSEIPLYRALHGDCVRDVELVVAPKQGDPKIMVANAQPIRDSAGSIIGAVAAMHDITVRKQAEERLLKSKEVLRIFVEHSPAAIAMFDRNMKYLVVSHRFLVDYNLGDQDIVGRSHYEVFPEISAHYREIHQRCLAGAVAKAEEEPFPRADGNIDWVRWEIRPWHEDQRAIGGIILFSEVITERKRIEIELEKHQGHLEDLVRERTAALDKNQLAMMNLVEDLNVKSAALRSANERLQELDRLKSMFVASMSHELRTPLNSIIGFSSILKEEWLGPVTPEQKENLTDILDSGKHLLALINEVIDISKLEAGRLESVQERFELKDLIAEAVKAVAKEAEEKGLAISVDIASLEMHTDRRRLLQCLLNLLSNAVKFTEQGEVIVTAKPMGDGEKGKWVAIEVSDTGIGIQPEDIDKLFKPFVRLHAPGETQYPGTGLGLYLTAKLTREVLDGEVAVASELGKGSIFSLQIPVVVVKKEEIVPNNKG